jgi:GT2 family glycosyltransferase
MNVSVVIATINRREELRRTLEAYRRQTHRPLELVVMDNGSTDGTREMIAAEFPEVVYEWLDGNRGTAAITRGFARATGDTYWVSNNDSYPESDEALARVVEILELHPDVDIVGSEDVEAGDGYRIYDWHPRRVDKVHAPPGGYPTNLFHGTGAAIRRRVIERIGGFWDWFCYEEMDLCARAIKAGFHVRYVPAIRTLHFSSPRSRVPTDRWVLAATNMMRYTWRHLPLESALYRSAFYYPYFLMQGMLIRARPREFLAVIAGMPRVALETCRQGRQPIPRSRLRELTLGLGPVRLTWNHLRQVIRRRWTRWRRGATASR